MQLFLDWKQLAFIGTVLAAGALYLWYGHFRRTYPNNATLPGPIKQIGVSYHRIPNSVRFKLYYPTSAANVKQSNSQRAKTYFKDIESAQSLSKNTGIPSLVVHALNDMRHAHFPLPCFENAPIASRSNSDDKYPLLLLSHGHICTFDIYSQLSCALASYGLIIAIPEHTDRSALYAKSYDNLKCIYFESGHVLDANGKKYKPKPWTTEHDVEDFGNRTKRVRVPEFIALYRYLTNSSDDVALRDVDDTALLSVLAATDLDNLILSGQSFGATTCLLASRQIVSELEGAGRVKCLLLLSPWFGCVEKRELQKLKWSKPALILSSEEWLKEKPDMMQLTQIVMRNGLSKQSVWEYGRSFQHFHTSDVPIWGPRFMTKLSKIYTVQEWSDLLFKRCASFLAEHVSMLKKVDGICFQYDRGCFIRLDAAEASFI